MRKGTIQACRDGMPVPLPLREELLERGGSAFDRFLAERAIIASPNEMTLNFVGAILTKSGVIACLPKRSSIPFDQTSTRVYLRLLLRALRKYASESSHFDPVALKLSRDMIDISISPLAVAHWLVRDYRTNGLYRRKTAIKTSEGNGQVCWQETIDRCDPYVSGGRPAYLDVVRLESRSDNSHIVTRLHATALRLCAMRYGVLLGADLDIVDHETVDLMPEDVAASRAAYALSRELRHAYSDRAIRLISVLRSYFDSTRMRGREIGPQIFGTTAFQHVWEAICGKLVGNEIDAWAKSIPVPVWKASSGPSQVADTFRPDIIRAGIGAFGDGVLLFDAKYYSIRMPPALSGNPGVYDVAKQLLYEILVSQEAERRGCRLAANAFLFPGECDSIVKRLGHVEMEGLSAGPVDLYEVHVWEALERYVTERTMSIREVNNAFTLRVASRHEQPSYSSS